MANDRIYQAPVEGVIAPTDEKARVSQAPVEAVLAPTSQKAQIAQMVVEAIYPSSNPTTPLGRVSVFWVG